MDGIRRPGSGPEESGNAQVAGGLRPMIRRPGIRTIEVPNARMKSEAWDLGRVAGDGRSVGRSPFRGAGKGIQT